MELISLNNSHISSGVDDAVISQKHKLLNYSPVNVNFTKLQAAKAQ